VAVVDDALDVLVSGADDHQADRGGGAVLGPGPAAVPAAVEASIGHA